MTNDVIAAIATPAGEGALGSPCDSDSACQTNLCELGACREACAPGQALCDVGDVCRQPAGAALAYCTEDPSSSDGVDATDGAPDGVDAADGKDGADASDGADADKARRGI